MKNPIFVCAGLLCILGASNHQASAVVLEQKWQKGETLAYDTNLSGSVNFQIPAEVPFFLAGMPLDVDIQGQGKTLLETLHVDETGIGTVVVKVPNFTVDAKDQTFGVPLKVVVRDNKSSVTLAGKPQDWGKDWGAWTVPTTAIKIGKDGKIKGFEPIAGKAPANNVNNAGQNALIASAITQALPALLPNKNVEKGDQWKSEVEFPLIAKTDEKTGKVQPLGNFDMTLKGEETIGKKSLWRIGVKGQIQIDASKVNALSKNAPLPAANAMSVELENANQTVEGDIWFDAETGQINKADLILNSNANTTTHGTAGKKGTPSWLDFTGTLQLKLADKA
jgi:hypothetical protein